MISACPMRSSSSSSPQPRRRPARRACMEVPVTKRIYTALFPFGGIGAGALGFLQAQHPNASFRILGGLDFDALACKDFEYLTGVPSWCVDVNDISPEQLRELYGVTPPDVVFLSPPCKGGSALLSNEDAESEKYQRMNWLAYTWIAKMLAAWGDQRPRLVLFENVPRLTARAPKMLAEVKALLEAAGYVLHEGYHDCGVLGGLAQHRRRYLMIARHRPGHPPYTVCLSRQASPEQIAATRARLESM